MNDKQGILREVEPRILLIRSLGPTGIRASGDRSDPCEVPDQCWGSCRASVSVKSLGWFERKTDK
jgi:hypothetical protein